jgi:trk system potassium uptake protein TrkH
MALAGVASLIGVVLLVFGVALFAPMVIALVDGHAREAIGFGVSGAVTVCAGVVLRRLGDLPTDLRRADALAVVAGAWLVTAAAGALPFVWVGLSPVDAFFESMSGLTTTGATILRDFADHGRAIHFWRAMSHWLGGMGVIALFIAVLPKLAIAGRDLFFAEASGPTEEAPTPQIRKTASALWWVYIALTALEVAALMLVGLSPYDAIVHAFATMAAGGFSPHPQSVMGYGNAGMEWVIALFMFLAGANFALFYRSWLTRSARVFRDDELTVYAAIVLAASVALAGLLAQSGHAWPDAARHALFQVTSIVTTTGFASVDFELWDDRAKAILVVLMFVGGCAGSAAGGPKVVRMLLVARYTLLELRRTLHPRAVLPVKLNGKVVPDAVMRSVLVFFLLYLLTFAGTAGLVAMFESSLQLGLVGSIVTLGNIGPGFGPIGPMGSFADLAPATKTVLSLAMWLGRLELMTVLVLLRPEAWRDARWRRTP